MKLLDSGTDECVLWGPEITDGRMTPVPCIDSQCKAVGQCARERDDA